MKKVIVVAAALSLAACGDVADTAANLSAKADAAINEQAAVEAATSAVDIEGVKAQAEGAAREAIQEALPTREIAAAAAVVDEAALVEGLDKAVDGQALGNAIRDAAGGADAKPTPAPSE
ncbi:MAG: hypothetical protein ACO1OD_06100 [Croceibacterium sp.]